MKNYDFFFFLNTLQMKAMHMSVNTTNVTMCGMSLATVFEINQKKLFGTIIFLKRKITV